jgi:ABC-2 type transport system permease protein
MVDATRPAASGAADSHSPNRPADDLELLGPALHGPVVAASLAGREIVRFFRQRNRVIGASLQPLIFWLLFSEGLKTKSLGYQHFFPGTLALILLFTAIFATISIIEDRREGFLQSVLVAPIPRWSMVLGKILGGAVLAMMQAMVFLALGWLTLDLATSPLAVLGVLALMFLIAVELTALGFVIAWRMDSTQGFHAIMSVFLLPMWLLSGAFFPAGGSGGFAVVLDWIVRLNPLTYGVAGLRQLLEYEQTASDAALPSLAVCWLVTILFTGLLLGLAWRIARSRTTGDLL